MKLELGDLVQLNQQRALGKWYVPRASHRRYGSCC